MTTERGLTAGGEATVPHGNHGSARSSLVVAETSAKPLTAARAPRIVFVGLGVAPGTREVGLVFGVDEHVWRM
jgi:hypothetical protein